MEKNLHPDLVDFVTDGGFLGPMIHHPLIIASSVHIDWINDHYEHKKKALEDAVTTENWEQYVFLHERPYRLDAFQQLDLYEADYWRLAGKVWTDSENIWQNLQDWYEIWDRDEPGKMFAMDEADQEFYDSLPPVIEVWRGAGHLESAKGLSWTTDKDRAVWFAQRFSQGEEYLSHAKVRKCDIHAAYSCRNENEIVTDRFDILSIDSVTP